MPSTKCEGLSYPTHFLKSRGSVIRNNFLEYRTKHATLFARRNDLHALFFTNQAKHIYLKPKVTLHFELSNISLLLLSLTKLNIAMSCWLPPCPNSRKTT